MYADARRTEETIARDMADAEAVTTEDDVNMDTLATQRPSGEAEDKDAPGAAADLAPEAAGSGGVAPAWRDVLRVRWAMFNEDEPFRDVTTTPWGNTIDPEWLKAVSEPARGEAMVRRGGPTDRMTVAQQVAAALSAPQQSVVGDEAEARKNGGSLVPAANEIRPAGQQHSIEAAPPMKSVIEEAEVTVNCRVKTLLFEGRPEARSIRNVIEQVAPRRLILVHGALENCEAVQKLCSEILPVDRIHIPSQTSEIALSTEAPSALTRLGGDCLASDRVSLVRPYQVTHLTGVLNEFDPAEEEDSTLPIGAAVANVKDVAWRLVTDYSGQANTLGAKNGDEGRPLLLRSDVLRLPDLRRRLAKLGVKSRFDAGALRTSHNVVVRRVEAMDGSSASVQVEGPLSDEYYKVKRAIYELHALV